MRVPGQPNGAVFGACVFPSDYASGAGLRQQVGRGAGLLPSRAAEASQGGGWIPAQASCAPGATCEHGCGAKQSGFAEAADSPVGSEAREPGLACQACSRVRVMVPASLREPARSGPSSAGRGERSALAWGQAGRCGWRSGAPRLRLLAFTLRPGACPRWVRGRRWS